MRNSRRLSLAEVAAYEAAHALPTLVGRGARLVKAARFCRCHFLRDGVAIALASPSETAIVVQWLRGIKTATSAAHWLTLVKSTTAAECFDGYRRSLAAQERAAAPSRKVEKWKLELSRRARGSSWL